MKPIEAEASDVVFDHAVALSRVGGDAELLKEIAILFLEDYPKSLRELHEAVDTGDARRVERTAHGLKGSVSNFGSQPAVDAAGELETLGRSQKLAEVEQVLHSLELVLAALVSNSNRCKGPVTEAASRLDPRKTSTFYRRR